MTINCIYSPISDESNSNDYITIQAVQNAFNDEDDFSMLFEFENKSEHMNELYIRRNRSDIIEYDLLRIEQNVVRPTFEANTRLVSYKNV